MLKKVVIVVVVILSLFVAAVFLMTKGKTFFIVGTVTKVYYRPNMVEDGRYTLVVKDSDKGNEYLIDATGFMNSFMFPSDLNYSCVKVPSYKNMKGATVIFNLPEDTSRYTDETIVAYEEIFDICHKKENPGFYFFKVLKAGQSSLPDNFVPNPF